MGTGAEESRIYCTVYWEDDLEIQQVRTGANDFTVGV